MSLPPRVSVQADPVANVPAETAPASAKPIDPTTLVPASPRPAPPRTPTPAPAQETNIKETIESILVAFILAFIFRAFIVEAFVIPTGSMAPTLFGAHARLRCPDCGYTFDVGVNAPAGTDDTDIPSAALIGTVNCPNCGYEVRGPRDREKPVPVRFGDRILVLKYLYLFEPPQRWDVVVFKSPFESHHDPKDPEFSQNYIKRLVGNPNESVLLLDGDVYIGNYDASRPQDFHIARKSNSAQEVLWRVIYDNDFVPQGLDRIARPWHQPWQPLAGGKGWDVASDLRPSRTFTFHGPQCEGAIAYDPEDKSMHGLTDWLVYDYSRTVGSSTPVSDLKISCFYRRDSGDGPLRLTLTKLEDCFTAQIERGKVTLLRSQRQDTGEPGSDLRTGPEQPLKSAEVAALKSGEFAQVEFANVDYRVSVRVNGKEVLATTDDEYAPNIPRLWADVTQRTSRGDSGRRPERRYGYPAVRISAANQECTLQHVLLARDIFYTNSSSGPLFWGDPEKIVHLKNDEYFVLGDNSPISGDARYWNDPVELPREGVSAMAGRVPRRFMLGRAFFVYWPAGFRPGSWVPFAIVPDFGEMRFIH